MKQADLLSWVIVWSCTAAGIALAVFGLVGLGRLVF